MSGCSPPLRGIFRFIKADSSLGKFSHILALPRYFSKTRNVLRPSTLMLHEWSHVLGFRDQNYVCLISFVPPTLNLTNLTNIWRVTAKFWSFWLSCSCIVICDGAAICLLPLLLPYSPATVSYTQKRENNTQFVVHSCLLFSFLYEFTILCMNLN